MTALTRRTLLKQLMTLPIAAPPILSLLACNDHKVPVHGAQAKFAPAHPHPCDVSGELPLAGPDNPGLNVFLHGLFLISTKNSLFDLYTPYVSGHVYEAGIYGDEKNHPLSKGSKVWLTGIKPGDNPLFSDTANHFIIPKQTAGTLDPTMSYFSSFQLPFPAASNPPKFRRKLKKPFFSQFLVKDAQHDDLGMRPQYVPLVYIFVYLQSQFTGNAKDINLLMDDQGKQSTVWTYAPNPSDPLTYDLHIDASPDHCMGDDHINDALARVNQMFTPPLTLALHHPNAHPSRDCPEDDSLAERNDPDCKAGKGGEVANCMAFLLGG